jgi:hypothetical protein
MAYAEIERIGRELNGMFYAYAYSGQEHAPSMHHHYRGHVDEAESSSSAMLDEVAMGIESLSVSFMDELDWAQEFSTSTTPSGKPNSPSAMSTTSSTSCSAMAEESCGKSFYFEDWASRLIGATSSTMDMDLDGMKCSAVESSPQQPCKALR